MSRLIAFRVSDDDYNEVWEAFRLFCLAKEGKLRGVLGPEATRAMREYLEDVRRSGAHTHILPEMSKHSLKKLERIKQAYDILPNNGKFKEDRIRVAINSTGVSHRTTMSEYKNFMLGMGLICRARDGGGSVRLGVYEKGTVSPIMENFLKAKGERRKSVVGVL